MKKKAKSLGKILKIIFLFIFFPELLIPVKKKQVKEIKDPKVEIKLFPWLKAKAKSHKA
jgi:hypothetical protein